MNQLIRKTMLAVGIAGALLAGSANANIIFSTGNPDNADTTNILVNRPCDAITTTGTTVSGCLSSDPTVKVSFTSNESLRLNGGQARVEALDDDGTYSQLDIRMQSAALGFTKLIFNVNNSNEDSGFIDIIVSLFGGGSGRLLHSAVSGGGNHFYVIEATGGDLIESVFFISNTGDSSQRVEFDDTRQIRLDGVTTYRHGNGIPPAAVPEPGSMALLALGLLGFGALRRKA